MITLLIPTMNRSDFLIRLIRYYWDLGFRGWICIADSSNAEHVERTKKTIDEVRGKISVVYREYPHLNNAQCVQQLLDWVSTPYAVLLPDDDFLVPKGLEECALFLDKHPDYSAAHGVGISVALRSSGAHGQVEWTGYYRYQPVIEGKTASQRLLDHLSNYSVSLFSVHRIESWRAMYNDVSSLADKTFGSELLPCCLSVIQGKVKHLDCFYLVRQGHSQRYLLPDFYDWIASANWFPSYQVFRDCLAEALVRQDGIKMDEARAVVKRAFWSYLATWFSTEWERKYVQANASPPQGWRAVVRGMPGARRTWRLLDSLKPKREDRFSLQALLRPSSPYHSDFMPMYQAITTPPAGADVQITDGREKKL